MLLNRAHLSSYLSTNCSNKMHIQRLKKKIWQSQTTFQHVSVAVSTIIRGGIAPVQWHTQTAW